MKKFRSEIEWATDVPEPEYVATDENASDLLQYFLYFIDQYPGQFIGFDTETHGKKLPFTVGNDYPLDWLTDTVILWSLACKTDDGYRRWCLQQQHLQYFTPLLENKAAHIVAWNAKYDAHVSWNSGVNLWNSTYMDAAIMNTLFNENRRSNSLKDCAFDHCGLSMTTFLSLFGDKNEKGEKLKEFETNLLTLPMDKVSDYASYDAYAVLKEAEFLHDQLVAIPTDTDGGTMWDYFFHFERQFTEVLWRMERRGLGIDIEYLKGKLPEINQEIDSIERDINRLVGRPVNVNAPAQLAKLFFGSQAEGGMGLVPVKMTKGGAKGPQASVDEEVLNLLVEQGDDVSKAVMRCRKLYKARSTYFNTLINLAEYYPDRRLHPNFKQEGARTGRISSTVPNSQNL